MENPKRAQTGGPKEDWIGTEAGTDLPPAKESAAAGPRGTFLSGRKTALFILEIGLIAVLLVFWLSSETLRQSKSLWILFFYCFPSEFLIAIVPHEPVLLYFSKFYVPLTVALISSAGTTLTELLNYSVFGYVTDLKIFQKFRHSKTVAKIIGIFNRAPFLALWVAGFTPIPFYPFRFLVVMAHYPVWKYILAVVLSRTPRFFLIALVGSQIRFPDYWLVLLFIVLITAANLPLIRKLLQKRKKDRNREP